MDTTYCKIVGGLSPPTLEVREDVFSYSFCMWVFVFAIVIALFILMGRLSDSKARPLPSYIPLSLLGISAELGTAGPNSL